MQTIREKEPLDLDRLREVEEYFSQPDPSNRRAKNNRSTQIEDLEDSDILEEWLRKRQEGTNLDPIKQRVPLQQSQQSDYLIELTRLKEPNTPSSLSSLTVPDVDISLINSIASTPSQPRKSAVLTPRRSSGLKNTPRGLLQQKQIEQIEKANQNIAQKRRGLEERFNPTASSTPCKQQSPKKNFLLKLSLGPPQNNEVDDNQISSSDEPSSIQANATNRYKEITKNNKSGSNKTAVEPVSTSQNDEAFVPCTQEQPNSMQSNEDEEIIPETQDTEQEPSITNPVQAPVNNSLQGSQQQRTNQQQAQTNGTQTPPNSATGVLPAWVRPIFGTPELAKNNSSRSPFLRKTPLTNTIDKRSNVVAQEIAQSNVLESTPIKSNRNNSFGQTLVVAVTNPSSSSTITIPSIQLNVNINGAMPQSSHLNGTPENDGTVSKIVELDQEPSANNGSNESIMTNDSDPLSDEVNKENKGIEPSRLDYTENISARRQLVRNFRAIEVENSPKRHPIENRTHMIKNDSTLETSLSARSTARLTFDVDSVRGSGSNILPPIDSRTFDKQPSSVGNATYDISKHGISTQASSNTFSKDVHNVSRRKSTIDVPDLQTLIATIVDLTTDSVDSSYDTDDADAEVARVTGPRKIDTSNGSSNHTTDSVDRDELIDLSEDSVNQSRTQTEDTQIQIKEQIAEKIQNEIANGKIPAAFNPVVVLKQLPADTLGQKCTLRTSTNETQQRINIRESESFSHMLPPIEFCDEPIIRDRSPESAIREFSIRLSLIRKEQTKPVNPPSTSKSKRRKKSVNPELEAVNKTHEEIHRLRSLSSKRASKVRKLFTHQNEDDDPVDNTSKNAKASTSTSEDNAQDDVFKKPSALPQKRSKISKTSSANQSSNSQSTGRTDHEQSGTNFIHFESTEGTTEEEDADQMNVNKTMEFEADRKRQSSKRSKRKVKTINKAKRSSAHLKGNISSSNIIGQDDVTIKSGRTKRHPHINSLRTQSIEQLKQYHISSLKRKLTDSSPTAISPKRPKLSETQSIRSKSSEKYSSRSKPSENHLRLTSKDRFTRSLTEQYITRNILQRSWWKNLCDMSENRKINRNSNVANLEIRKVAEGKRIESVSLDSIEFQKISNGFDIGIIPSERIENRLYGYMRLKPSAVKEAATAEYNTFFYIFNGEIVLNADSEKWELIGGDTFHVKAGIDYEIQNVGEDICILAFNYRKD